MVKTREIMTVADKNISEENLLIKINRKFKIKKLYRR